MNAGSSKRDKSTALRDLGTAAPSEPGAAGRGVTAARIAALTTATRPVEGLSTYEK